MLTTSDSEDLATGETPARRRSILLLMGFGLMSSDGADAERVSEMFLDGIGVRPEETPPPRVMEDHPSEGLRFRIG